MATIIIGVGTAATFGTMTNQTISRLISANTTMARLREAIETASAGYTGTPGTEFEVPATSMGMPTGTNLFSVQPDPDNPGARGSDYKYAMDQLSSAWETFWEAAQPYIEQLDNGT